ncbi:MAG: hypothetical protein KAS71_11355, partial [Bacteroidales bacterium]|nr:hypothetical protein [Bacteroidales bacterium]
INYNNFSSTLTYDQIDPSNSDLDARFNYWGPIATAEINTGGNPKNISTINDYYDDQNRGKVNYSGWLDAPYPEGIPSPGGNTGDMEFIYSDGTSAWGYNEGDTLFIQLYDEDLNLDINIPESAQIEIWCNLETNPEILTLTEIESDTGLFRGWMLLDQSTGFPMIDGKLQVDIKNSIYAKYKDALDDWNNTDVEISDSVIYNLTIKEYEPDENTVLLLHFNEGNGQITSDVSPNSFTGVLGNDQNVNSDDDPSWIPGISGKALNYNGINQFVKLTNEPLIDLTEGSIEAWIFPKIIDSDNWFFAYAMDTHKGIAMCVDNIGSLCLQLDQGSGDVIRSTPNLISENKWYHVAATWKNDTIYLYLNNPLNPQVNC